MPTPPKDASVAFEFGAKGIGLCRTEHMFFESNRIPVMQEMILANSKEERVKALDKLEVMQTEDFRGIFKAMKGNPCTVRLLDPPLHEFLPHKQTEIEALATKAGLRYEQLKDIIVALTEVNPMLGHRGCRLMITYPEITEMQTRAIINAACDLVEKKGGGASGNHDSPGGHPGRIHSDQPRHSQCGSADSGRAQCKTQL